MNAQVKLHPNETPEPSEKMTAKANASVTVMSADGKKLTIKKPDFFASFELEIAMGDKLVSQRVSTMLAPITYLSEIDGSFVPPPSNYAQVKALINRLGDEGYKALLQGIIDNFSTTEVESSETLKNS